MANYTHKLLRWSLQLQQYNLQILHRPGKKNLIPDTLADRRRNFFPLLKVTIIMFAANIYF